MRRFTCVVLLDVANKGKEVKQEEMKLTAFYGLQNHNTSEDLNICGITANIDEYSDG